MVVHCSYINTKQIRHALLRHPKGIVVEYYFNTSFTLCSFIQYNIGFQRVLYEFRSWNSLRKIFPGLLHERFLPVCILGYNHAGHTRQPEYVYLSVCTTTKLDHINRLVEMVINIHSFLIGYGNRFVYDVLEFPICRIPHGIA